MLKKLFSGKDSKNNKDDKYKFVTQEPTTKTCPNCGSKLEKIPKWKNGKVDCPHCGDVIVVRSGKLFAEDEAKVRDWLESVNRTLFDFEISREKFNSIRQGLSKKFGLKASVNDTLWRILNSVNTPDKSYQSRKFIYLAMKGILRKEGKKTHEIMVQAHRMDLLDAKENTPNLVAIILTCNDDYVCDECKKLSTMTFTIDEALETMPIPYSCTTENCRCGYAFTYADDD